MYNFITNNDFITSAKAYKSFDGYKCGLSSFDKIMRIDKQTLTTLVSTPCSGKSTFTNFYGYRMGVTHNWRTLYLASETAKNDQAQKLSTLYGSYTKASEHSIILEGLTNWDELIQAIKAAKEAYNIDLVIVDNFTMLQHLIGGEINTTNIGKAISTLKQAAIDTDTAIILVAHTTKLTEGQKVTAYSVNGSANFFNISDFMFSIEISDHEAKETTINVLKLRDDAKGVMNGKCVLKYNTITRKYTDSDTDSSTPSQHDTPKDINKDIATDVMKAIMEEEAKQAKQEDRQPAGNTTAAAQAATDTAANTPSRDNTSKQPAGTTKAAPAVKEEVTKEKANTEEIKKEKQEVKEEKQEEKQHITPDFLLNTKVSIMKRHNVLEISSLYNAIIMGKEHKKEIEAVRRIDRQANESEYRRAKDNILSFTPSCVCKGKTGKAENVEHVNNLIAIDLDAKDNEGVTLETMRTKINSLPYVMYSSLSVGGKGMYALIAISESNKNDFKAVFNALNEDFKALGLTLDGSCVNVNRERYMSFDDNEYWNDKAEIYDKKISIPTQVHTHPSKVGENANKPLTPREKQKVNEIIEDIKANKLQLSKNHKDTLGLANCLANIMGEEGRELLHIIRQQRSGYDEFKIDKTFDEMLDKIDDNERYGLGFLISKYKEAKQGQTQAH
ncbi:BT4734/BF3469 family protein [Prevotella melaninogenica]|jgi:virE domain protein|uniref:BT4734/BF3469 family protein n=1 Tax=Prevotella melaninogenica TaxID=28132 RepID=UPI002430C9FF|nr:BT4734/BF3469 family protein [Prevotella melaninogenica]